MTTYLIATDAVQCRIEAATADDAAKKFADGERMPDVEDAADLEAYLRRVGGFGTMAAEDGETVFDVRA